MSRFDDNDPDALNRLEDLLDAYADARLAPRSAVLARIRANVLSQAAALSATTAAENRLRLVETQPRTTAWSRLGTRFARTSFALGFAAVLTLGTSIAVLAAPAGSAFYNARVFIETAMLPRQPEARFEGHEKLLEERLGEAEAAAARGDVDALAAALTAYQAEVDAATADAGADADWLAHLQDMLAKHTATLTELAASLPDQASIEHAIDASSKAITGIEARQHPSHPTRPPQGGGGAGSGGQGGDDQDGNGGAQGDNGGN